MIRRQVVLTLLAWAAAVLPMPLLANQTWDDDRYEAILSRIKEPVFPQRTEDITHYGASPDATPAHNQQAINEAISHLSSQGGGTLVIPDGHWQTGAIRLQSSVCLHLSDGATLQFAFDPSLYPLVRTRWEGMDLMNYSPCIYAADAHDIAITGHGTLDGSGSRETWWPWCGATKYGFNPALTPESQSLPWKGDTRFGTDNQGQPLTNRNTLLQMCDDGIPVSQRVFGMGHGMRPQLVGIIQCTNVLIQDLTFLRSPFWVIHPALCQNVILRHCTIINEGPNGDGCDPESCQDVLIEDCTFHTGDDCIAIKSGRNADGRRAARPSQDIIIRRCTMEDGHGGVVIGSEISGGAHHIFAEDCRMDSPNLDRVLRIKTNTCRGGVVEHIYMRRIQVGQCREAVMRINLQYEPKERSQRGFLPTVRSVFMSEVTCRKSRYGILLNGLDEESRICDINVRDCRLDGVTDEPVRRTGLSSDVRFTNLIINGQDIH